MTQIEIEQENAAIVKDEPIKGLDMIDNFITELSSNVFQ